MPRIAIITDVHAGPDTGRVRGDRAMELLRRVVPEINDHSPDLLVDLGDRITERNELADLEQLRAVKRELNAVRAPKLHLRGNHDIQDTALQEHILGASIGNQVLDLGGWRLVALSTFDGSIGGSLDNETLGFLQQQLAASSMPTVVFSHQPLHGQPMIGNQYFEREYAAHACAKNHAHARAILEMHPQVRLCISGHAHWNDFRRVNGVPYLTVISMSESWFSGGLPCGAWAVLDLGDVIRAEVLGRAGYRLELPNAMLAKPQRPVQSSA